MKYFRIGKDKTAAGSVYVTNEKNFKEKRKLTGFLYQWLGTLYLFSTAFLHAAGARKYTATSIEQREIEVVVRD